MRRALVLALSGVLAACGGAPPPPPATPAASRVPPNPRRATPPPGVAARAAAVGTPAPAIHLPATTGDFDLAAALARRQRVLLVFYRGDW